MAIFRQFIDDDIIGFLVKFSVARIVVLKMHEAFLIHGAERFDAVFEARVEIVHAMIGRDMNEASARFFRDIIGKNKRGMAAIQRMGINHAFQFLSLERF